MTEMSVLVRERCARTSSDASTVTTMLEYGGLPDRIRFQEWQAVRRRAAGRLYRLFCVALIQVGTIHRGATRDGATLSTVPSCRALILMGLSARVMSGSFRFWCTR